MSRGRSTAHVGGMGLQRTTDQQLDEASDGLPAHRGSTFKRCPVRVGNADPDGEDVTAA
jgi:hypothetical protein